MQGAREKLTGFLSAELGLPCLDEAHTLCDEIRRRHGDCVAAVLFYGSCLRKREAGGGVLDFYVLVDDYRSAYASRLTALANAWLPPNVFLMQLGDGARTLRAKYAVVSTEDFRRAARPDSSHSIVWSRFCQPARIVWSRDDSSRSAVTDAVAEAVLTMVRASLALVEPESGEERRFTSESLWQTGFGRTYGTELRTEHADTIRQLFDSAPQRYETATLLALETLAADGELARFRSAPEGYRAELRPDIEAAMKEGWRKRAGPIKALYAVRLVKSAFTFGDWLPYALWKLNRHTGVEIEPTPLQRRHPFLFGWPVIAKLLLSRKLR